MTGERWRSGLPKRYGNWCGSGCQSFSGTMADPRRQVPAVLELRRVGDPSPEGTGDHHKKAGCGREA